jgi:CRP-like cAMP-binding protein
MAVRLTWKRRSIKAQLAQAMQLITLAAFTPLFGQGGEGDAMYVVVVGEVGMYINPAGRPTPIKAEHKSPTGDKDVEMSQEGLVPVYGCLVFTATSGDAFGELALVTDEPRAASAVAQETGCQLASLSRAAWQGSLRKAMQQKVDDKMTILRALPAFSALDEATLRRLSYYFKPLDVPRRTNLIRQGAAPDTVYLIQSGDVLVNLQLNCDSKTRAAVTSILGSGELVGAFLDSQPSYAERALFTATTQTECTMLTISRSDLLERAPPKGACHVPRAYASQAGCLGPAPQSQAAHGARPPPVYTRRDIGGGNQAIDSPSRPQAMHGACPRASTRIAPQTPASRHPLSATPASA